MSWAWVSSVILAQVCVGGTPRDQTTFICWADWRDACSKVMHGLDWINMLQSYVQGLPTSQAESENLHCLNLMAPWALRSFHRLVQKHMQCMVAMQSLWKQIWKQINKLYPSVVMMGLEHRCFAIFVNFTIGYAVFHVRQQKHHAGRERCLRRFGTLINSILLECV